MFPAFSVPFNQIENELAETRNVDEIEKKTDILTNIIIWTTTATWYKTVQKTAGKKGGNIMHTFVPLFMLTAVTTIIVSQENDNELEWYTYYT